MRRLSLLIAIVSTAAVIGRAAGLLDNPAAF
jgi:hypothetical protein